ncbi:MotA/TolQ/ExbB proton channel family protein [uncultured Methanobrevibacter sp.]|uniref:MotA/TolQ/ExbB proton channel family protein n=1 Tax=uncultured Methanobrevibacter sp. TaxID=253161 RepID=UPI0026391091
MTAIPGSDLLTSALNVISQSLQIPVIIFLIIFALYSLFIIGSLISEYSSHKKIPVKYIRNLIYEIANTEQISDIPDIIKNAKIQKSQKIALLEIAESSSLTEDTRRALARKLFEDEQDKIEKILQKTDIVTKIGPTLGLMGTLIPMGPGLAALGSGDVTTLASAIIVAFDTTVVGIGAGAVAYVAGKIRRRWYEQYLSNLDALADTVLDRLKREDN